MTEGLAPKLEIVPLTNDSGKTLALVRTKIPDLVVSEPITPLNSSLIDKEVRFSNPHVSEWLNETVKSERSLFPQMQERWEKNAQRIMSKKKIGLRLSDPNRLETNVEIIGESLNDLGLHMDYYKFIFGDESVYAKGLKIGALEPTENNMNKMKRAADNEAVELLFGLLKYNPNTGRNLEKVADLDQLSKPELDNLISYYRELHKEVKQLFIEKGWVKPVKVERVQIKKEKWGNNNIQRRVNDVPRGRNYPNIPNHAWTKSTIGRALTTASAAGVIFTGAERAFPVLEDPAPEEDPVIIENPILETVQANVDIINGVFGETRPNFYTPIPPNITFSTETVEDEEIQVSYNMAIYNYGEGGAHAGILEDVSDDNINIISSVVQKLETADYSAQDILNSLAEKIIANPAPGCSLGSNTFGNVIDMYGGWFNNHHTGVDLVGCTFVSNMFEGAEIVAIGPGLNTDPTKGGGPNSISLRVRLDPDSELARAADGTEQFLYVNIFHNEQINENFDIGQILPAGIVLGTVGNEGTSTAAHAHIEMALGPFNALDLELERGDAFGWESNVTYIDPTSIITALIAGDRTYGADIANGQYSTEHAVYGDEYQQYVDQIKKFDAARRNQTTILTWANSEEGRAIFDNIKTQLGVVGDRGQFIQFLVKYLAESSFVDTSVFAQAASYYKYIFPEGDVTGRGDNSIMTTDPFRYRIQEEILLLLNDKSGDKMRLDEMMQSFMDQGLTEAIANELGANLPVNSLIKDWPVNEDFVHFAKRVLENPNNYSEEIIELANNPAWVDIINGYMDENWEFSIDGTADEIYERYVERSQIFEEAEVLARIIDPDGEFKTSDDVLSNNEYYFEELKQGEYKFNDIYETFVPQDIFNTPEILGTENADNMRSFEANWTNFVIEVSKNKDNAELFNAVKTFLSPRQLIDGQTSQIVEQAFRTWVDSGNYQIYNTLEIEGLNHPDSEEVKNLFYTGHEWFMGVPDYVDFAEFMRRDAVGNFIYGDRVPEALKNLPSWAIGYINGYINDQLTPLERNSNGTIRIHDVDNFSSQAEKAIVLVGTIFNNFTNTGNGDFRSGYDAVFFSRSGNGTTSIFEGDLQRAIEVFTPQLEFMTDSEGAIQFQLQWYAFISEALNTNDSETSLLLKKFIDPWRNMNGTSTITAEEIDQIRSKFEEFRANGPEVIDNPMNIFELRLSVDPWLFYQGYEFLLNRDEYGFYKGIPANESLDVWGASEFAPEAIRTIPQAQRKMISDMMEYEFKNNKVDRHDPEAWTEVFTKAFIVVRTVWGNNNVVDPADYTDSQYLFINDVLGDTDLNSALARFIEGWDTLHTQDEDLMTFYERIVNYSNAKLSANPESMDDATIQNIIRRMFDPNRSLSPDELELLLTDYNIWKESDENIYSSPVDRTVITAYRVQEINKHYLVPEFFIKIDDDIFYKPSRMSVAEWYTYLVDNGYELPGMLSSLKPNDGGIESQLNFISSFVESGLELQSGEAKFDPIIQAQLFDMAIVMTSTNFSGGIIVNNNPTAIQSQFINNLRSIKSNPIENFKEYYKWYVFNLNETGITYYLENGNDVDMFNLMQINTDWLNFANNFNKFLEEKLDPVDPNDEEIRGFLINFEKNGDRTNIIEIMTAYSEWRDSNTTTNQLVSDTVGVNFGNINQGDLFIDIIRFSTTTESLRGWEYDKGIEFKDYYNSIGRDREGMPSFNKESLNIVNQFMNDYISTFGEDLNDEGISSAFEEAQILLKIIIPTDPDSIFDNYVTDNGSGPRTALYTAFLNNGNSVNNPVMTLRAYLPGDIVQMAKENGMTILEVFEKWDQFLQDNATDEEIEEFLNDPATFLQRTELDEDFVMNLPSL